MAARGHPRTRQGEAEGDARDRIAIGVEQAPAVLVGEPGRAFEPAGVRRPRVCFARRSPAAASPGLPET